MNTYQESDVFEKLKARNDLSDSVIQAVHKYYQKLKIFLPDNFREQYHFYYFENQDKFTLNIMNYRIFKIWIRNRDILFEICYPIDGLLNLSTRVDFLDIWSFKVSKCYALTLSLERLSYLNDNNWADFSIAVNMLANSRKSRLREKNVYIAWDDCIPKTDLNNKKDYQFGNNDLAVEKERLLKIRIAQGYFKRRLKDVACICKICRLSEETLLIASHIKPWSSSSNEEKIDIDNGFLLCPNHDALFDKGYISFDNDGNIVLSNQINRSILESMHIHDETKIEVSEGNRKYLDWHREHVFKK